jgi:branched-chain amino acid aminotransferase
MQAQKEGFHQLVWTDAAEHKYIEESGTMNIVFQIGDKLITPDENHDTILRGITKRSVFEIAEKWGVEVEERMITVAEIIEAAKNGSLKDAFGAGTAATIAPIAMIGYEDEKYVLPPVEERLLSNKIKNYLGDLKTGRIADEFGWNLLV